MTNVYLFCLSAGFVFTVVGALIGQFAGGGDGDGGLDGDGDGGIGDAEGTDGGGLHLPLLSPTVLSCYATAFGGSGLIYQYLFGEEQLWLHFPLAGFTGLALGVAMAWTIWKVTTTFSAHRTAREEEAIGAPAEVTVSIPEQGVGEVAFIGGGTRQATMARSIDGRAYKQGTAVRIVRLSEGTAYVTELPSPGERGALQEGVAAGQQERIPVGRPVRVGRRS